ncbi:MAG: hypothetical protein ACRDP6_23585, partial [Actinoallomurus sp.]
MNELGTSPPADQDHQAAQSGADSKSAGTTGTASPADGTGRSGTTPGPGEDKDTGFAGRYLATDDLSSFGSTQAPTDPPDPFVRDMGGQHGKKDGLSPAVPAHRESGPSSAFGVGAGGGAVDSTDGGTGGGGLPQGFIGGQADDSGGPPTVPTGPPTGPPSSDSAESAPAPVPDAVAPATDVEAPAPDVPVLSPGAAPESASGPASGETTSPGFADAYADAYAYGPREGDPAHGGRLDFAIPVADIAATTPVGPVEPPPPMSDAEAYNLWTSIEPDVRLLDDRQFAGKYEGLTKQEVIGAFKDVVTRIREQDSRAPKADVDHQYQEERRFNLGVEVISKVRNSPSAWPTVILRETQTSDFEELGKAADAGDVLGGVAAGVAAFGPGPRPSGVTGRADTGSASEGPADAQRIRRIGDPAKPPRNGSPSPRAVPATPPAGAVPPRTGRQTTEPAPAGPPRAGAHGETRPTSPEARAPAPGRSPEQGRQSPRPGTARPAPEAPHHADTPRPESPARVPDRPPADAGVPRPAADTG